MRTIQSISTRKETDLGRDLERLAEDLRAYDQARGLENEGLGDNIRALRDKLRDLATYLTRSPPRPRSPASIVSLASEPQRHPRIQLRDSPVPRLDIIPEIRPPKVLKLLRYLLRQLHCPARRAMPAVSNRTFPRTIRMTTFSKKRRMNGRSPIHCKLGMMKTRNQSFQLENPGSYG